MLYKKFLIWLMSKIIYKWLLLHVIPYIRFTTYYTSLRGWKYVRGYKLLKPGDIILTKDRKKLTSLLIGGDVTHAALCVHKGSNKYEVAEMTHNHYTKSYFFDVCKESDRVIILRCRDWSQYYTKQVIERCKTFENAKYDVGFSLGIEALYCSELVYQSDFKRKLKVSLDDLADIGRPYIAPQDLLESKNCDVIWDSDEET